MSRKFRISKDGFYLKCPAAHRTILVKSCSQSEENHCDYFQGIDYSHGSGAAFVLCDYGLDDRKSSIVLPVLDFVKRKLGGG